MSEHGGGDGAACGFSHPDQSANWNMAFQSGENAKIDMSTLKKASDPRMVIGGALVAFMGLISLPCIMDMMEDEKFEKAETEQAVSVSTPAAGVADPGGSEAGEGGAQDGQIFANGKQMFDAGKAQVMNEALNVSGLLGKSSGNPAHDGPDMQFHAAMGTSHSAEELSPSGGEDGSQSSLGALSAAADIQPSNGAGVAGNSTASAYTQEAVSKMVADSGMAHEGNPNRFVGTEPVRRHPSHVPPAELAAAGAPHQQAPVAMAPPPMYGGAVQSTTQPYLIFVPGAPAANVGSAQQQQPAVTQIAMAPGMPLPAVAQAGHPGMPYDQRSAFNPQTSAIVAPLGMRHHAGMMPMIPAAGPSGDYAGAGGRMRVFVNR